MWLKRTAATDLVALKSDTAHKKELILRALAEDRPEPEPPPFLIEAAPWRPYDPKMAKAIREIRARMRELAKRKITRNYV
jgi:hypothetical protein